ncbi:MAG: hypothetical protein NT030_07255 [Candidatus Saganbacteria bacterium]|nr:hypothetical protein [Candidatus Saganbacteria bacterium]
MFEDKINGTNKTNGGVKAEDLIGKITEIRVLIDEEGKFDREKGLARDNFIKKVNEKDALSPQEKEKYVQDAWKKFNAKRQEFEQNIIERIVTIKTEITKLVEEIEKNMRALQEHNDKKLVLATSDTRLSVRKILNEVKSIVKKLENRELLKDEEYQKVFDNLNATEGETATLSKDAAAKNETKPVLTRISDSMLSPALLEELSVLRAANPTETDILLINRIASKVTLFLENTRKWAEKDPETAARIIDPNYAVSVGDVMEALLNRERQPKKETLRQIKPEEKILIPELSAEERKTAEDHLKQLLGALEWIPRREVKELALPLEVAAEMPRWKQLFGASDDNDVISKWAKIMQTLYQIAEKRTPQGQAPKVMETIGALPGLLDRIKTLSEEVNNATNQIDQLNKTLKERDKELSGIEDLRKQAKRVSHLGDTILRLEEEKTASLQIKEAVSSLANALEKGLPIEPIDTEDFLDENLPKLVNFVTELKNAYESLQKEYADYIKILNTFFAPSLEEIPDLKQIEQDYSNIAMDLQVAYKNNPQIAKRINERNLRPLIKKIVESLGEKSRILQEMLNKLSGKTEASKEDDFGFDLVEDGKPQDKGETSDSGVDLALEVLDKTGKDEK